jgi:molybdopterin-guanine dinucleotide biosynthesis protein A
MEYDSEGPLLNLLVLIGGKSSRMGTREELLSFQDGRPALEHALETLHGAVPSASTIYIYLHNESQLDGIETQLKDIVARARAAEDAEPEEHDHHQHPFPELKPIFDRRDEDMGPAAGLLAAHSIHPAEKWLVIACDYPLLSPAAFQQLILEYQPPLTCFVNESGIAQPLIGIWDEQALEKLKENVGQGENGLESVVMEMEAKLVKPLREIWIMGANTREEK